MYLMRFRLKLPVMIEGLFSNVSFSSRVFMKSLLNLQCFIEGCLQTTLIKWLFLLGISTSINVDSNSLGQYIWRSFLDLYERFWKIYIKVPPAEDSVGVCSVLKHGRSMLVVCVCFVEILLSERHIISTLWLTRLRKVLKSSICAEMEEMFQGRMGKTCCLFIFSFLQSEIS